MGKIGMECIVNKGTLILLFNNINDDVMNLPLTETFFVEWRKNRYDESDHPRILFAFGNGSTHSIDCENAQECVLIIHKALRDYYSNNKESGI